MNMHSLSERCFAKSPGDYCLSIGMVVADLRRQRNRTKSLDSQITVKNWPFIKKHKFFTTRLRWISTSHRTLMHCVLVPRSLHSAAVYTSSAR